MRFVESVKLWWEIKHDEWVGLRSKERVNFTKYEIGKLMELDGGKVPKKFLSLRGFPIDGSDYFFEVCIQNSGLSIYIYVGEKDTVTRAIGRYDVSNRVAYCLAVNCIKIDDGWFLVDCRGQTTYFFYKCDGIEGLLDLIKILGFTYG
jgi:hypothetical protein